MFSSNTSQVEGGYQISRSLRFNSADSTYLNRTPAGAGNRKTFTWSGWVKRSGLTSSVGLFSAGQNAGTLIDAFEFNSSDQIRLYSYSNAYLFHYETTAVYRDVSAWYHIVVAVDTTQATASNRVKLYVNGVQVTAFSTQVDPTQNSDCYWFNTANVHALGATYTNTRFLNGYMTEVNFIDGQALTPSSFGETNAQTGVWQPKAYSGSYGTNGFYLNFSDNSNTTATTLGKDYSGNGNNWTPNNFSVTAGAGNDSMVDTPTPYGGDTGAGGDVRGNYCTWNPLSAKTTTLSNGNLDGSTTNGMCAGTIAVSSGKWYWECTPTDSTTDQVFGIISATNPTLPSYPGGSSDSYGYYGASGRKYNSNFSASYGAAFGNGDVIGVALDLDAGTLVFYKNGSSQGTAYSGLSGSFFPGAGDTVTNAWTANFGQRPFAYTAPSGFRALCTQNLPTPTIGATSTTQAGKYFNPVLYTGNGSTQSITGLDFQPDFVWIKSRSAALWNNLYDAIRGVNKTLYSNDTFAEYSDTNLLTAFNSNGFSAGNNTVLNQSAATYVAWNWKANGAGVTNTAGSITSTVSANTTSGFSIATFTIQSSGSATVGHGLGVAPSLILVKTRNIAFQWDVYHASLGKDAYLVLNSTDAQVTGATTVWNSTAPTSTVFSLGSAWPSVAPGNTAVAYCFAPVAGYSAFGSYTGNGSADGPFVFCGFRPRLVMAKNASNLGSWVVLDTAQDPYNIASQTLNWNSAGAVSPFNSLDIVSNGFKMRNTNSGFNTNGDTYIFVAFAENPFKYSLAR